MNFEGLGPKYGRESAVSSFGLRRNARLFRHAFMTMSLRFRIFVVASELPPKTLNPKP